jgi:putative cardiolipin synthase
MKRIASTSILVGILLLTAGCSSLPPGANFPRQESHAVPPQPRIVERALKSASLSQAQSAYSMLSNGIDGLAARLELIDAAERALDLQYYIFRGDTSGRLVAQALLRAADRGVRVRVLVDDGESIAGDERVFALAAHPLIQIRVFNPFDYRGHGRTERALDFVFNKKRLDHRMHNKLLVADNAIALIGGRNIGDQYFQIAPDSQFGDDDVAVVGPMVQQLSSVFDEFWNMRLAIPVDALNAEQASPKALDAFRAAQQMAREQTPFESDLAKRVASGEPLAGMMSGRTRLARATAQLVYDSPDKSRVIDGVVPGKVISTAVESRADGVNTELLMITPYFVPSSTQLDLLKRARGRGVRVRVLTNSLEAAPDVAAHSGYTRFRPTLLEAGVELFEIRARVEGTKGTGQPKKLSRRGNYALHAKLYVFDRLSLFVGSMNFDQRSEHLNTEIGLLIDSPDLAAAAATRFESLTQLDNAYAVRLASPEPNAPKHLVWETEENGVATQRSTEPARSGWQRFKMRLLSWLPLDKEL